jgi:hypothetical protein
MATTRRSRKRRSILSQGYDSLTLDPSPRLRRTRRELFPPSETALASAWKSVASAMTEAVETAVRALREDAETPRS